MTTVVYWNQGAINLVKPLKILHEADSRGEFRMVGSSQRMARLAPWFDALEREPKGLTDQDYIAYLLDRVSHYRAQFLVPGIRPGLLAANEAKFAARGCRVLSVADAATLQVLGNKLETYARLAASTARLPDYLPFHDSESFAQAIASLSPRHALVCFKPAESVYGIGFRVICDDVKLADRQAIPPELRMAYSDAVKRFKGKFSEHLAMEYLEGPERSVDCLAQSGKLLRCVVRRKMKREKHYQLLESHPEIEGMVRSITEVLNLSGVFNIQFRDQSGVPYLLEINARMSGGIRNACHSGLAIPYWWLRLAAGTATADEIPWPKTGIRVEATPARSLICLH